MPQVCNFFATTAQPVCAYQTNMGVLFCADCFVHSDRDSDSDREAMWQCGEHVQLCIFWRMGGWGLEWGRTIRGTETKRVDRSTWACLEHPAEGHDPALKICVGVGHKVNSLALFEFKGQGPVEILVNVVGIDVRRGVCIVAALCQRRGGWIGTL